MTDPRKRARELAQEAVAGGRHVEWFESLYAEAARGEAIVPWDDRHPNALLVRWLDGHPIAAGARALDVGCGGGDNSVELAQRGARVTAFDVSASAIELARARIGESAELVVADLLAPPASWRAAFDLIVEIYTLQVLTPAPRAMAMKELASLLAANGTLLVIARAREPEEPEGTMPWPLTRAEIESFDEHGLRLEDLEGVLDDESPPVRRWIATLRRV